MGKLIRAITVDGAVMAIAVDSTDIVSKAEQYHKTSAVMTAALGRLLTAASMMGNMLKGKDNTITLRISGNGPAKAVVAVSDSNGDVRGYTTDPVIEIPLKENGKLDVSAALGGKNGMLTVIKDVGLKEPYNGSIPLFSGEIAEDITAYYAVSEQIPTVCALGVLVNPDLTVNCAGGYIIQLLPGADNKTIDKLEENIKKLPSVTNLMSEGKTIDNILFMALEGFQSEILYETEVGYKCSCSRERTVKILAGIEKAELLQMADEGKPINVECHFCNNTYSFSSKEINEIAKMKKE